MFKTLFTISTSADEAPQISIGIKPKPKTPKTIKPAFVLAENPIKRTVELRTMTAITTNSDANKFVKAAIFIYMNLDSLASSVPISIESSWPCKCQDVEARD